MFSGSTITAKGLRRGLGFGASGFGALGLWGFGFGV